MDAPLVDEAAAFFLRDTLLRLTRLIEIASGYWGFVLLLYCRFLSPGGSDAWSWFELGPLWALVFTPLFLLDWRSFLHWKYLRANREWFSLQDGQRYLLICISESIFKILLCVHLMFKSIRPYLTFKVVMLPYAIGYVLHFVLGHFVPLEEGDRPEGCNMVAAVFSDLVRFLGFILLISISLKLESHAKTMFDWQAALWPCWGLEGILLLVTALLLPICLASMFADRPRVLMLTWIIISAVCFGTATFVSVYNMVKVLDDRLCPQLPCTLSTASKSDCTGCQEKLELVFWPWLAFLPAFAIGTLLCRRRIALALHEAWYQPARPGAEPAAPPYNPSTPRPGLPPPPVLFRVTATYYSRTCEAALLDNERLDSGYTTERPATFPPATFTSLHSQQRMSLDPSTSILSARGATFTDLVESEQLCFICYSEAPDTVLLECGHAGICATCALHLMERRPGAQCPICRSGVAMVVRLRADLPVPVGLFQREQQLPEEPSSAAAARDEDMEAGMQGPPWPSTAKRCAVVVELVQSQLRTDFRWWRS